MVCDIGLDVAVRCDLRGCAAVEPIRAVALVIVILGDGTSSKTRVSSRSRGVFCSLSLDELVAVDGARRAARFVCLSGRLGMSCDRSLVLGQAPFRIRDDQHSALSAET
eukprot:Amastigsp_a844513_47.p3 type:complete len:109 gc:universal Amastigsp_a844513_47:501-175(-)